MSELGCADGCGRRGCKGVAENGWGEEAAGDERAWLRGRLRTAWVQGSGDDELGCADGCGRRESREWVEMGGEKQPLGDERAWLRGRLRTAWVQGVAGNVWGEEVAGNERAWLRGRLRTAWLQGGGWKWVGRTSMENGCLSAGYVRVQINLKIDAKGWGQGIGGDMG